MWWYFVTHQHLLLHFTQVVVEVMSSNFKGVMTCLREETSLC